MPSGTQACALDLYTCGFPLTAILSILLPLPSSHPRGIPGDIFDYHYLEGASESSGERPGILAPYHNE